MGKIGRYEELKLTSESELEDLLASDPTVIEPGMHFLARQWHTRRGPLDMLLIDQDGRVVVAELKLDSSDDMLFQGLDYLAWVHENIHAIQKAFKEHNVSADLPPRLILIAASFSDILKARTRYLKDEMQPTLLCYRAIIHNGENLIVTNELDTGESPPETPPVREEEHRDYLDGDELKNMWDKTVQFVKALAPGDVVTYSTASYLGFRYRGQVIAVLRSRKAHFFLSHYNKDGEWIRTRLQNQVDLQLMGQAVGSDYLNRALND